MEDPSQQTLPPPATLEPPAEPISRPSSTSTQASIAHNLAQLLPSISSLAASASNAATNSPPTSLRNLSPHPVTYSATLTSPASTHPGHGGNLPTCQNCATSTTPLWRRDEMGAVLCNACGLFLKLHGRPRPISLKTDVIKSRNRVKTMRPDLAKKKQQAQLGLATTGDLNGMDGLVHNGGGPGGMGAHRTSQKSTNGHGDDTNSPISRTGTPGVNNAYIHPMYQTIDDPQFQAQHLPGFAVADPSPGRPHSPMNSEMPQTHEQLIQANASLKTRVSELEVIQELYRGRLQQLENEDALRQAQDNGGAVEAQLRQQLDAMAEQQTQLQNQLEESHRRENMLKRRLDELELELKDAKDSFEAQQQDQEMGRAAKKLRVDEDSNAVTTKSTISGSDEEGEGTTDTTTTTQSES